MTSTCTLMIICLGFFIYRQIAHLTAKNYQEKLISFLLVNDEALNGFFSNVTEIIELVTDQDLMKKNEKTLPNYLDKTDPSGKVKVRDSDFEQYEGNVFRNFTSFVHSKSEVLGMGLGLENEGGYTYSPAGTVPNNFDPRKADWYTEAKKLNSEIYVSPVSKSSDGGVSVVISRFYKGNDGLPRGVACMETSLGYIESLMELTHTGGESDELFIVADETGTIIVNQLDSSKKLTKINDLGFEELKNFRHGENLKFRKKVNGKSYEFRTFASTNKFMTLDYVFIIPVQNVDSTTDAIKSRTTQLALIGFIVSILASLFISRHITNPLKNTVSVLKNISEGEGDLTQRLPVKGNDEITQLSKYFNLTMEKLNMSIHQVIKESNTMSSVASVLTENVATTSSAVNEISANIGSVKQMSDNQNNSVTEMVNTMQLMLTSINELSENIGQQSDSVYKSTGEIEQLVSNISSVMNVLNTNEEYVSELIDSADNGRRIIEKTVELTEKISQNSNTLIFFRVPRRFFTGLWFRLRSTNGNTTGSFLE